MKYRKLGKQGFDVSEVGLGCWQLGGDWGEDISKEKGFEILQAAVDSGVRFFDTADVYGGGKSETILGAYIKNSKTPLKIATKFGRSAAAYPDKYSKEIMRTSVLGSLERLGLDSIDLLQLHCIPTRELQKGHVFDWLRDLQSEGLIKHYGASVESVDEGLLCLEQEELLSLQVIFNVFRQKLVNELLPRAQEKGVGIIVRLPLASGLLTGKFNPETRFAQNDHRYFNQNGEAFNVGETFAGLPFHKGLELVDALKLNYLPESMSLSDFALRWILDHPAVSTIIPGASSTIQIKTNAAISELNSLDSVLHVQLKSFYTQKVHQHIRGAY
ncbi:MAG: aldo/keto reductase [Bacteroidetes bacterium HGW-Bacteroidetes-4]|jgi:aryl-alcohol dehydrogenase-like predicted oxidoreductase|nr:MAG: aldo/keto reductase [Bacteroidetes bacterium HGW-Bacteroidetes-4]